MTLVLKSGYSFDPDASTYIDAVETADGEALETGVRVAINEFVLGCKQDGIWDAIKASCILAGARTLNGALVPLVGTAPTNFNFVSGDYDRETGLVGDGSTKYLDSNRNNNADPQNDSHLVAFKNDQINDANPYWIGAGSGGFSVGNSLGKNGIYSNSSGFLNIDPSFAVGLHGVSRSNSSTINYKRPGLPVKSFALISTSPPTVSHYIFNVNINGSPGSAQWVSSRLTFYSIGESLDLAKLDTRVSNLITAIGGAI